MKTCKIVVVAVMLLSTQAVAEDCKPDVWGLSSTPYFADLKVTETVTRRELRVSEIMELLDRLPTVKVVYVESPPRPFSLGSLAYPQYADRYLLTQAQWAELQRYCTIQLKDSPYASPAVLAHWKSIVDGTPPFGLKVADK